LAVQSTVSIRNAISQDRAFVVGIANRLVDGFEVPGHRTKPELIEGDRRALATWFDHPSNPGEAMLIAEIDGKPAGCAYLVTLVDYFNERPHAHLSVLAVAADAEGRGVGSALLDHSVAWAKHRNSDRLTLSALVTNSRARSLYERKGFAGEYIRYVLPIR
jgi:ribosomal protein S18 acetylase RimI-like enzyme